MIKKQLTYSDFDGRQVIEEALFHLGKKEQLKLVGADDAAFQQRIKSLVNSNNPIALLDFIAELVDAAFGKRSEDGKRFVHETGFSESLAFDALIDDLINNGEKNQSYIENFVLGILGRTQADLAAVTQ